MDYIKQPKAIEDRSMELIAPHLAGLNLNEDETAVYSRMIHTTGDVEYGKIARKSDDAVEAGLKALAAGARIYTDVEMVRTGTNKRALAQLNGEIFCRVSDPEVAAYAKEQGITRSMAAMRMFGKELDGSIIAIGNAPTALFEVIRMMEEDGIRPALIIGIPVGFVGAAESKEELIKRSPVPYITVVGNKGGSPVAASVLNAMLYKLVQRTDMLYIENKK